VSPDERELIAHAQKGDTVAFAALVDLHAQFVYNLALRLLRDPLEAEDIAQEAFIRCWRSLPRFRGEARFSTWLYRIVTNLCLNRRPQMQRELTALTTVDAAELAASNATAERALLSRELRATLLAAIDDLPAHYQLLISLRHLQGMSYAEIAAVTELPLGTVKTGIFRARGRLRRALAAYVEMENG
jgi:RNA polymerase sigma-70 factor, ECF subfamily